MIVSGTQLELNAQSYSSRLVEEQASIRFWKSEAVPRTSETVPTVSVKGNTEGSAAGDSRTLMPLSLAAMVLERFFGLKVTVITPEEMTGDEDQAELSGGKSADSGHTGLGWGMEITATSRVVEEQSLDFSAQGKVITADGRELSFSLDLQLSRRFEQTESVSLRMGDAPVDPLVLQLQPGFVEPSSQTFIFDLDGDGRMENVPVLQSGAFFLVNDRNGDGVVNTGLELFGPESGSGFSELANLDGDGNHWIDEADAAFFNLRLWQPDSEGKGNLISLLEAGVGALSIDSVSSPWQMEQGSLSESGVFLYENGGAGHLGEMLLSIQG